MKVLTDFTELVGQPVVTEVLTHWARSGHAPHALLFTGPDGSGKKTAGLLLAKALLCKQPNCSPCGECLSCKKADLLTHPDLWILQIADTSKKGEITIDQIRDDILEKISYRPFEGEKRVVLIPNAHRMNTAAANALLKALEEPPAGTYFILTAPSSSTVIPTIRSRCQKLRFIPLTEEGLQKLFGVHFSNEQNTDPTVLSLLQMNGEITSEDLEIATILRNRILFLARRLGELPHMPMAQKLALAEYLGKDREAAGQDLDILWVLIRSVAVASTTASLQKVSITNEILQPLYKLSPRCLFQAAEALTTAKRQIMGNTTPRLCLEKLFLILSETLAVS